MIEKKQTMPRAPDLEEYIHDGNRRRFITYPQGQALFGMHYWSFVNLAKRAGANIKMRKTAVVDLDVLERYLESLEEAEEEKEQDMARKEKAPIAERMTVNGKKYVRLDEAAELYSVSEKTIEKWAADSKARLKVGGVVLYNTQKIDMFIENIGQEEF
ncbi:DUF6462 family protein [Butyrivibrio sp.]|uniref:DUF6462 family protein n=1 Tax=Butyrivibrio sp. TaxID=28121 RepID=UPI0025C645FA|nr:DUF6462 family protein [Butyrivibrio sp.]